jgi:UDP-N-acetyl-D-mannosaminuronic acid transferase (WecB/TagA/CpsF family)
MIFHDISSKIKNANVINLDDNRFVQELSIKLKNSRFKIVVLIELKISNLLKFESEIFNSIKTTNLNLEF